MNNNEKLQHNLKSELFKTLIKNFPTTNSYSHLKDIISLLMEALSKGNIYIRVDKQYPLTKFLGNGWPTEHIKELTASGWLKGNDSPVILTENRLYFRRWHEEMNDILDTLIYKSQQKPDEFYSGSETLIPISHLNSEQQFAVNAISNHNVILLSGGPGTGKTTTIVQMIMNAISINKNLCIGLAAPTGKAARRLEETIKKSIDNVDGIYKDILLGFPCLTLHRWLKATESSFLRNKSNLLPLDILIIDEMSMVDIPLMQAVLNALPKMSQLILVGDPDQLPPIGSGAIWQELQCKDVRTKFGTSAIHLEKLYRNKEELADLASIVRTKSLRFFFSKLSDIPTSTKLRISSSTIDNIPSSILKIITQHQQKLSELSNQIDLNDFDSMHLNKIHSINKLINSLEELIVLCPRRYGLWSVDHINKLILGSKLDGGINNWPQSTPVICGENQPELNLSNGDVGIILGEGEFKRILFKVNLSDNELGIQLVHPIRLKKIDPAIAITIHKSQGSEANHVICLWPDAFESMFLDNQSKYDEDYAKRLIYTAITRAKSKLDLAIPFQNQ
ncbi:exodeoxyribonuclease V subunit alpha [Prochlorococcus marinus]|uniref:exodeoxyribonuclease V subunit alpha n=1 Tax=Prochlorococcus marinus TaxID=1219 RepID=UPI0022B5CE0C|nr:exodeoxyribonuclease V subunit alpha [Prochlorococcus marinus]